MCRDSATGDVYWMHYLPVHGDVGRHKQDLHRLEDPHPDRRPGDLTGDALPDLLSVDSAGALWIYPGKGNGTFAARVKVGTGWNQYNSVRGHGDFTGDGKADLIARTRPARYVYLYKGTGKSGTGAFAARIKVRTLEQLQRLRRRGDVTGDGKADFLARTPGGTLYLYKGTGKATSEIFATRISVGTGFQQYDISADTAGEAGSPGSLPSRSCAHRATRWARCVVQPFPGSRLTVRSDHGAVRRVTTGCLALKAGGNRPDETEGSACPPRAPTRFGSSDHRPQAQPPQARGRRSKALLVTAWIAAGIVVLGGTGARLRVLQAQRQHQERRHQPGARHRPPHEGRQRLEDILVLGSDTRSGANRKLGGGTDDGSARSDTAMIVHVYEGHKKASVVSIPRDTLVDRPPCTDAEGRHARRGLRRRCSTPRTPPAAPPAR